MEDCLEHGQLRDVGPVLFFFDVRVPVDVVVLARAVCDDDVFDALVCIGRRVVFVVAVDDREDRLEALVRFLLVLLGEREELREVDLLRHEFEEFIA